jgi:hypothetical protein
LLLAETWNRFELSYKNRLQSSPTSDEKIQDKGLENSISEENSTEKTTISGVEVNNFFLTTEQLNENNDRLLEKNEKYSIIYHPLFTQFLIAITDSPFPEIRKSAEQKFLEALEINEENACKLDVVVSTASFINPEYAGSYRLSFCE